MALNLIQRAAAKVFRLPTPRAETRSWNSSLFLADQWGQALTGVTVTPESALNMATVHACIRVLSEAIAVMPLLVFRRLEGGGKERARTHPLYPVLAAEPNPHMTAAVFQQTLMHHLLTWGNAYARIVFDRRGVPAELWPLDPGCVTPGVSESGSQKYLVTQDGQQEVLDAWEVLHVPGLSHDGRNGLSPVGLLRETIGLGLGLEKFAGSAVDNGAWMAYVIRHPNELDDEVLNRLRDSLKERQGGIANAYRPGILEDGAELQQLRMPGDDAFFLATRKFEKRELASAFRVPPHMLADLEGGASYSSIEVMSIEFARYSLGIWLSKFAQEFTRKLVVGNAFTIEFVVEGLLRGDTQARYTAYRMGRDGGWLNVDEIRALENMPPLPDDAGQGYLVPLNMGVVGGPGGPVNPNDPPDDPPPDDGDEPDEDEQQLLMHLQGAAVNAAERMNAKERDRAGRYAKKGPEALQAWAERFYANQRGPWLAMLEEYAAGMALAMMPPGTKPQDVLPAVRAATREAVDVDLGATLAHLKYAKDEDSVFLFFGPARSEQLVLSLAEKLRARLERTTV